MTQLRGPNRGRGWYRPVVAALGVGLIGSVALTGPMADAAPEGGTFFTSFEATDPQLSPAADPEEALNFTGAAHPATSLLGLVSSASATKGFPAAESPRNAADLNPSTKWLAQAPTDTLTYALSAVGAITGYAVTSANDAPGRDPKNWTVEGSFDGTTWRVLDTQTNQVWQNTSGQQRLVTKSFNLAAPSEEYRYYRLAVTANNGDGLLQIADFNLVDSSRQPVAGNMITVVDNGPTFSHTAKTDVGWTGTKALRYAGQVIADGASSSSKVLYDDLSIVVGDSSELSYKIFPVLDGGVTYSATHVAVDLVFDDNTQLSTTAAVDSHGFGASARAQGEADVLWPDQWNSVKVDLSAFSGRTIKQVQLDFDMADGVASTPVKGWVDDISVADVTPRDTSAGLVSYVDTRRASNSTGGFSRGNNFPGAAWPNGFNFLTPFTNASTTGSIYEYQRGNNAQNLPTLQGIGFSHEPSIWMGDRDQFVTMPSVSATPSGALGTRALAFRHENEVARPDLYAVTFDNGIKVEAVPTDHAAVLRYTFPGDVGSVVVDQGASGQVSLQVNASGAVTGYIEGGSNWANSVSRMFVSGRFDAVPTATGAASGRTSAKFGAFDTSTDKTVELRVATSFISQAQADKNLAMEATGRSFDELQTAATTVWNERLGVITDIEGAGDEELGNVYSDLYRLNMYPNSQFENTGTPEAPVHKYASPFRSRPGEATDTQTNAEVLPGKVYVNNGFWDTYRTAWPMYAFLYPDLSAELVDGFVQHYRDSGWISRWSAPGYADLMTGTSSDVAFAEAYLSGALPTALALESYDAALRNATALPPASNVGRKGIDRSIFLGWTESTTHESASWGLEGYINDYGIANMAAKLAADPETPADRVQRLKEEAEYFTARADHFVEMFNPAAKGFTARNADGSWPVGADFDKQAWGGAFTEAAGWTFGFHAPHNVDGLAALYGGRRGILDEFDRFLSTQEKAARSGLHEAREARDVRLGYLALSNQVSHHIPYTYIAAGGVSEGQALVADIMKRLFVGSDIGQGYPGDEDNGEFSAWYLFSAMGFYPLQVGSGDYTVGTPLFDSMTVNRGGQPLVVKAPGASDGKHYVAGLSHNGAALASTDLDGDLVRAGGTLEFTMSDTPSAWGAKDLDEKLAIPDVLVDATKTGFGTLSAADGTSTVNLNDDKMSSAATFSSAQGVLTWKSAAAPVSAHQYTITSAAPSATTSAPQSWVLEGSNDGTTWTKLDERSGQTFPFGTQTRPFSVTGEAAFSQFRLTLKAGDASKRLALAEVELFASAAEGTNLTIVPAATQQVRVGTESSGSLGLALGGNLGEGSVVTVEFGDGTALVTGALVPVGLGGYTITAPHVFTQAGVYTPVITVTDTDGRTVTAKAQVNAFVDNSLRGQMNVVCVATLGVTAASCDGQGWGYLRDKLDGEGFVMGKTLTVPGTDLTYDLPVIPAGQPDVVTSEGQTIQLEAGKGATKISFIGMANEGSRTTTATLTYADGTTQAIPIGFNDWVPSGSPSYHANNILVALTQGRSQGLGAEATIKGTAVFSTAPFTLAVDENGAPKHPVSITLAKEPGTLAANGRIHIFAVADNGDRSGYTDLTLTPGADGQVTAGTEFTAQLGTVTGGPGGQLVTTVNWGDGSDVATASVADGAISGSHTYAAPGTYTVWVTVTDGVTTARQPVELTVVPGVPTLTGLAVTTAPSKVAYTVGDALDLSGLVVTATYSDGSTRVVPTDQLLVEGFDPTTAGQQTVSLTYGEAPVTQSATFTVTVAPKPIVVTGIEVTASPSKVNYLTGESLDLTGMEVTATYSDGHTALLPNDQVSVTGFDGSAVGTQTLTVSHQVGDQTLTDTFTVQVTEPVVAKSLELTKLPAQVEFTVGDQFSAAGLEARVTFSDGTTATVGESELVVSGYDTDTVGKQPISVSYTVDGVTVTASYVVTVKAAPVVLTDLQVTSRPSKVEYTVGDALDLTGMVVEAIYSDGTTKVVPAAEVKVTGFNPAIAGEQTLTVSYAAGDRTVSDTFTVTVVPKPVVVTGLAVTRPPTRSTYSVGDRLDLSGIVVSATWSDGSTTQVPVEDLAVTGFNSATSGTQTVTLAYAAGGRTVTATITVTVRPRTTPVPTPTPKDPVRLKEPYEVPGFHNTGGRWWYTTCEPYSQTIRCRTDIWSKQVVLENGKYVVRTGWFFNNLTYLPFMTKQQWGNNPLARAGEWTNGGRRYKTACNTPATGANACRSYIWAKQVEATQVSSGKYSYRLVDKWVFNNIVRFSA